MMKGFKLASLLLAAFLLCGIRTEAASPTVTITSAGEVQLSNVGNNIAGVELTLEISKGTFEFTSYDDSTYTFANTQGSQATIYSTSKSDLSSDGVVKLGKVSTTSGLEVKTSASVKVVNQSLEEFNYADASVSCKLPSTNTESGNTGSGNTGSGSTGSGNTGSGSTGSGSTGSGSTGSGSTGSGSTGSGSTGSGNTGSGSTTSGSSAKDDNDQDADDVEEYLVADEEEEVVAEEFPNSTTESSVYSAEIEEVAEDKSSVGNTVAVMAAVAMVGLAGVGYYVLRKRNTQDMNE